MSPAVDLETALHDVDILHGENVLLHHVAESVQSVGAVPAVRGEESGALDNLAKRIHLDRGGFPKMRH